jgi:hypothetical protein
MIGRGLVTFHDANIPHERGAGAVRLVVETVEDLARH